MDTIEQLKQSIADVSSSSTEGERPDIELDDSALKVDEPIPGQQFTCLSFINPEDVIVKKDQWRFYKYHQSVIKTYHDIFSTLTNKVLEKEEVSPGDVADLQERMTRVFNANETDYKKWSELVKDYEFKHGEANEAEFDKQNNYQTSIRGVKVRGTYATQKEATVRCKVLQKLDPRFHVWVAPVGYWIPSNPNPDRMSLKDQEYANNELNTLMKEYHKNEELKDQFYEEQYEQRTREEVKQVEQLRKEKEKSMNVADVTDETAKSVMDGDDIWMRRRVNGEE